MTTHSGSVPTQQNCPSCNALVYYEGHSELRSSLVPHRFHCHACGGVYLVRSTSHKPPRFRISMRHAAAGASDLATAEAIAHQSHEHGDEQPTIVDGDGNDIMDGDSTQDAGVETQESDSGAERAE